jgi:RHS repeat-associated protein
VVVRYALSDAESDPATLEVRFSTDSGASWSAATELRDSGSEGRSALATSPAGVPHLFVWDAGNDLPALPAANVTLELTPADAAAGAVVTSGSLTVTPAPALGSVPFAKLIAAGDGVPGSPVPVFYSLHDSQAAAAGAQIKFSLDRGATWRTASEAAGAGSEGLSGLASAPSGRTHFFAWNAAADLPAAQATGVQLRVEPATTQPGRAATSEGFDVDAAVIRGAPTVNATVQAFAPQGAVGNPVPIYFMVRDPDSMRVDVQVQRRDGGGWVDARPGATSDATTNLPAPHMGADYRFLWDGTGAPAGQTTIRFTVYRGGIPGGSSTVSFDFDPNAYPAAKQYQPPAPIVPQLELVSRNPMNGLSGQLFPETLVVRVRDAQNNALGGVPLEFVLLSPAPPVLDFEPAIALSTLSNANGEAGIRLRARPNATASSAVTGQIEVRLAGMPAVKKTVDFRLDPVRVIEGWAPSGQLAYGKRYTMHAAYEGDGDRYSVDFEPDAMRPIRLRISARGASGTHPLVPAERVEMGQRYVVPFWQATFPLVPTTLNDTVTVKIDNPDDPAATAFDATLQIATPKQVRQTGAATYQDLTIHMRPLRGLAGGQPQVGWPGLTLAEPFQVHIRDDISTGRTYTHYVIGNFTGCVAPQTRDVEVIYEVDDGRGTLSASTTPGSVGLLQASLSTLVYFTPAPPSAAWWLIEAAAGSNSYADPSPISWNDAAGQCQRQNAINADPAYNFVVRLPRARFVIEDANGVRTEVTEAKPGERVILELSGLSPTLAGGTPGKVALASLLPSGAAPGSYARATPALVPTSQELAMTLKANGILESAPIALAPTDIDPAALAGSGPKHGLFPGGWLRARIGEATLALLRVPGVKHSRLRSAGRESPLENRSGSTPFCGHGDSVSALSGELVYRRHDISMGSRGKDLAFHRTYRSHALSDGPLGPGWFFAYGDRLELYGYGYVPVWWTDASGRRAEVGNGESRGLFRTLTRRWSLTDKESAYEIEDPHKNVLHFNIDGSLRMARDHLGRAVQCRYDERGRLVELKEPLGRTLAFEYWTEANAAVKEIAGRIKEIKAPGQRSVKYEYYDDQDLAHGGPGYLKKVSSPKAATFVNGGVSADYERTESYVYERVPATTDRWRLKQVLDSLSNVALENEYDGEGRVKSQQRGAATYTVTYPSVGTTVVEDPAKNETEYHFPAAPYLAAFAPDRVTRRNNRAVAPAPAASTFIHNAHGMPVETVEPSGATWHLVYDEDPVFRLRHGNLLAARKAPSSRRTIAGRLAAIAEEVWSWEYHSQYNYVTRAIPPEGNAPGSSPGQYARRMFYRAHDAATRTGGHLLSVREPRVLNCVIVPPAAAGGLPSLRYIPENPTLDFSYNDHGLVTAISDRQGVVTKLKYYTGTSGGSAESNGGLLAEAERDAVPPSAEWQTKRDNHLPDCAPEPEKTTWTHDETGDVASVTAANGDKTEYQTNGLREVTATTETIAAGGGTTRSMRVETTHNVLGLLAHKVYVGVPASSGGGGDLTEEFKYDDYGNPLGESRTLGTNESGTDQTAADALTNEASGEPRVYSSPDALAGPASSGALVAQLDEHGLPASVAHGAQGAAAATAHQTRFRWSPNGDLQQAQYAGGRTTTVALNEMDDPAGIINPEGATEHWLPDLGGATGRSSAHLGDAEDPPLRAFPASGNAVGEATEARLDEGGRVRRVHEALFQPGAQSDARLPSVPEYFPEISGMPWPPGVGASALPDGAWGKDDARSTFDLMLDAQGRPTRLVDDELGSSWARRDARGRPLDVYEWTYAQSGPGQFPASRLAHAVSHRYAGADNSVESTTRLFTSDRGVTLPPVLGMAPVQRELTLKERHEYDGAGRLLRSIDGMGQAMRWQYDATGHAEATYDASGPALPTNPAFNGRPINDAGAATSYKRNGDGLVMRTEVAITDTGLGVPNPHNSAGKCVVRMEHHPGGLLRYVWDNADNKTSFLYDQYGRVRLIEYATSVASGGPGGTSIGYDATSGLIDTVRHAGGPTLKHKYKRGQLAELSVDGAAPAVGTRGYSFARDADGSSSVTDLGTNQVQRFQFDAAGRLWRETQGALALVSTHDGNGNRTGLQRPGGLWITFEYDGLGRLRTVRDDGTQLVRYEYLGRDRIVLRQTQTIVTAFTHRDGDGRLMAYTIGLPGAPVTFTLERDRMGRITRRTRRQGTLTETKQWWYDSAGRLVREAFSPAAAFAPGQITTLRFFDGDSVLREQWRSAVGSPPQQFEQRREERGRVLGRGTTTFGYDPNGNLINDGQARYVWDAFGRLARVERTGQQPIVYEYDSMNRRTSRTIGTLREDYVYDGMNLIEVRSGGAVIKRIVYGSGPDDPITIHIGANRYFVLLSPEGHVDTLYDANGTVLESYDYALSGEVTVVNAARQKMSNPPLSPLLFQCRFYDTWSHLYHYGQRWYHPGLGFFLSPDPASFDEGTNFYGLCHGDPVNRTDATGAQDEPAPGPARPRRKYTAWDRFKDDLSVGAAFVTGFYEGELIGLRALANAVPKTLSLGFYEGNLFGEPDNPFDRDLHRYASIPARIATECLAAAGTMGLSVYVKGLQGATWGVRALRGVAYANNMGHIAAGTREVIRGGQQIRQGNVGWGLLQMVLGGLSVVAGVRGMRELSAGRAAVQPAAAAADPRWLGQPGALTHFDVVFHPFAGRWRFLNYFFTRVRTRGVRVQLLMHGVDAATARNMAAHEAFHAWLALKFPNLAYTKTAWKWLGAYMAYFEETLAYAIGSRAGGQNWRMAIAPLDAFRSLTRAQAIQVFVTGVVLFDTVLTAKVYEYFGD